MRAIERAVGQPIERKKLEGFDYQKRSEEKLEIPIQQRIAEIRARKAEERARAKAKAERKASNESARPAAPARTAAPAQAPARHPGVRLRSSDLQQTQTSAPSQNRRRRR